MKTSLLSYLLSVVAVLAILISISPAVASPDPNGPLSVAITLASAKTIVPGQPVVLRYLVANNSASMSAHFDLGQNGKAWYRLSLVDSKGASAQIIPDLRPRTVSSWGLYQTGDRVLSPSSSLQGSIVVTRDFAVTRPGKYLLTVQVPLNYMVEDQSTISPQGTTSLIPLQLNQIFTCTIEVKSVNPAAVRATAEELRHKLTNLDTPATDQWEPVAEELFSMPEAQVLPVWQALVSDPTTPDRVRIAAAGQLAYHPSFAAAALLGEMLWNPPLTSQGGPLLTEVSRSEIARALVTMKDVASPDVKQQIRLLNSQHRGQTPDVRGASAR